MIDHNNPILKSLMLQLQAEHKKHKTLYDLMGDKCYCASLHIGECDYCCAEDLDGPYDTEEEEEC